MPFLKIVTNVLSRTIVIYAVATTILFGIVNHRKAVIARLNVVLGWGDYPAQLEAGAAPYEERRLRFAIRYYKMVAEILPKSDQPYAMIGYCYARLGDYSRSIKYYEKALEKRKDHFWLEYNLGMLHYRQEDFTRAYAIFQNIAGRDMKSLVKASVLTALPTMTPEKKHHFFAQANDFAVDLKEKSFQMLIRMDIERQNYSQAMTTAMAAVNDPVIRDKGLFFLYAGAAAYGAGQGKEAVMFCRLAAERDGVRRAWSEQFLVKAIDQLSHRATNSGDLWRRFLNDPKTFPRYDAGVVIHPWAFFIQPGKEVYM